ncbi:unnamed protein product [Coregonus sp. 'balchen']|nr:unnamed protein product [Coregonus sp. 'balchen']
MDEDSHCSVSSVCGAMDVHGASLPSNAVGLTSPPYTATPVDHDYTKRKTLRRQQQTWQQQYEGEQQADGTVPVLDSGPMGLGPSFTGLGSSGECSQDSVVVMLLDNNSTQDAFTDPASSQASSHIKL